MTALSNISDVSITRQTSVVAVETFGVPAIIGQFLTTKTTAPLSRARHYGSLSELEADGWTSSDSIHKAATLLLGQAQKVNRFMVGRIDAADSTLADALAAIQLEIADWYGFGVVGLTSGKVTLSSVLITDNVIASSVAGITIPDVTFTSDHATTMAAWESAIESAISGAVATVSGNTISVTLAGRDMSPVVASISGGASQPSVAITYSLDQTKILSAAAWANAQKKIFGVADADPETLNGASVTDLAYLLKQLGYDRVWGIYHGNPSEYAQFAWMGLELAKRPGQSTWAEKSLQGVSPDLLTEGQLSAASGNPPNGVITKNMNTYTPIATSGRTLWGNAFSGENISVIRNLDYAAASIQADNATLKFQLDIIPASDVGVVLEENALRGTLTRMEVEGILRPGETEVTTIPYANWAPADKASGTNRMSFKAGVQKAILASKINGVVTL